MQAVRRKERKDIPTTTEQQRNPIPLHLRVSLHLLLPRHPSPSSPHTHTWDTSQISGHIPTYSPGSTPTAAKFSLLGAKHSPPALKHLIETSLGVSPVRKLFLNFQPPFSSQSSSATLTVSFPESGTHTQTDRLSPAYQPRSGINQTVCAKTHTLTRSMAQCSTEIVSGFVTQIVA